MVVLQSPPHPALQDHIAQYLFVAVDNTKELGMPIQKFFPIDIPCLSFYIKPLGVIDGNGQKVFEASSIYTGVVKWGSSFYFPENQCLSGFLVALKPHGLGELFRLNHTEVDVPADFYNIAGREGVELHQKLNAAGCFSEQIRIADEYFLKKKPAVDSTAGIREVCWQIIVNKGLVDVRVLAELANLSVSSLERKFTKVVGVSPKQLARFKRFHYALRLMDARTLSLTDIAHTCGYYDQAHFIRDFQAFTDQTPSSFNAKDYPIFYQFILYRNYYC